MARLARASDLFDGLGGTPPAKGLGELDLKPGAFAPVYRDSCSGVEFEFGDVFQGGAGANRDFSGDHDPIVTGPFQLAAKAPADV